MGSHRIRIVVKFLCSLIFFWGLYHFLSLPKITQLSHSLRLVPLAVSVAILLAGLWFNAWKVDLLVGHPDFSVWVSFRLNLIKQFFNNVLPSGLGGEISRTYYLGKWEGSLGRGFAIVVFDRLTTQAALCVFTSAALSNRIFHGPGFWINATAFLLGLAVFSSLSWSVLWLCSRSHLRFFDRIPYLGKRIARANNPGFRDFFQGLLADKNLLWQMLWMSLCNQVFWIARFYFLVKAFGLSVPLDTISIVLSVSTLLSILPISLGGLGLNESVFAAIFKLTDSAKELGFAVAILGRLTSLLPAFWGWMLFLCDRKNRATRRLFLDDGFHRR